MTQGTTPTARLVASSITVRFGGITAVQDVSFSVDAGEVLGIIGPNGAGKSTLLDVVAGRRKAASGMVELDGIELRHGMLGRARHGVARTFQSLSLFPEFTVREHVELGWLGRRRSANRPRSATGGDSGMLLGPTTLLTELGLDDVADQLAISQPAGTARLVDLARALAQGPSVVLLDEPVSGLTPADARRVGEIIHRLRDSYEILFVVVEHNLEFVRQVADRLVALSFGEVIAQGRVDDVLSDPRVRSSYLGEEPLPADGDTGVVAGGSEPTGHLTRPKVVP